MVDTKLRGTHHGVQFSIKRAGYGWQWMTHPPESVVGYVTATGSSPSKSEAIKAAKQRIDQQEAVGRCAN